MKKLLLNLTLFSVALSMPIESFSYGDMIYDSCCHDLSSIKRKDLNFSVDYLYWNTCRSNLGYEVRDITVNNGRLFDAIFMSNGWNPGFRVNAEYACQDQWNANARFTWFRGSLFDRALSGANEISGEADFEGDYTLDYKILDLDIGTWVSLGCYGELRPYVGLKFSWIDDVFKATASIVGSTEKLFHNNDFNIKAYGAVIGADFRYDLNKCFDLVAKVAFGTHYGDVSSTLLSAFSNEGVNIDDSTEVYGENCRLMYSSEFALGLERALCFCQKKEVVFSFGYEFHGWDGLTTYAAVSDNIVAPDRSLERYASTSLILHGLFIRLIASF